MRSEHGGDLYSAEAFYPGELLDFSVNLNPLGAPGAVIQAAVTAAQHPEVYPDPACRRLRQALGQLHHIPAEWILCGNGASELIYRLAQGLQPKRAMLTAPTFSEYEASLNSTGCKPDFYELEPQQQFDVQPDILEQITPETELVLLCNPNNPTGRRISAPLLERILERCTAVGSVLAVDECFLPLCDGGEGMLPFLQSHANLILIRAFTKSYAIPGLRLGYCLCSNLSMLERLEHCGPCWNVSAPAQAAGIACCQCPDWPAQGQTLLKTDRPMLQSGLEKLGLTVVTGEANYLLFRSPGDETLQERLLRRGILLRSCWNYRGLGPDWYRVAVRSPEDNDRLLNALEECIWQR